MANVSYKLKDLEKKKTIKIGYVGENNHMHVRIDCEEVFKEYPNAAVTMAITPPEGEDYPKVVTRDGNVVEWTVANSDVAAEGYGEFQMTFTEGEVIRKTVTASFEVIRSIVGNGTAPSGIDDFLTDANAKLAAVDEAIQDAEDAASHAPTIGNDGYWYRWDADQGEYVSTGTKAQGEQGDPGSPGDPTQLIDDTAGEGQTGKTWSADKLDEEITDVKNAIQGLENEVIREKYTPVQLVANKGWNANNKSVGDSFNPDNPIDNTGTYCARVTVTKGDKYKINANSGAYAFRSYVVTNSSLKITRITTDAFDGEITIAEGETKLYVTMQNYNSSTNGLWKITNESVGDAVDELKTEVEGIADKNFADVVPTTEGIVTGKGYNMGSANVGDTYTSTTSDNENAACQVISVEPNTTYKIYGVGNLYSYCLYAVLDENNKILEIEKTNTEYRDTPKIVTPAKNAAKIIVNYWTYKSLTDHTTKQKNNTIDYLFTTIEEPLNGKKILLLGDSILASDRFNGVSEYLKQKTGATIINGAVGGTRLCGTTRGVSPFTAFDGENLVTAITTGVWTDQEASKSGTGIPSYVADETLPALEAMAIADVDIVIFNWMTNDYRGNTSKATYQTAFDNVVSLLLTANPKLRLLSCTLQWFDTVDGGTDETEQYTMGTGFDAADCTIESAEKNHVPVIDMYRGSPVSALTKTVYMDSDYLHPNTKGNMVYADLLAGKLKTMF